MLKGVYRGWIYFKYSAISVGILIPKPVAGKLRVFKAMDLWPEADAEVLKLLIFPVLSALRTPDVFCQSKCLEEL